MASPDFEMTDSGTLSLTRSVNLEENTARGIRRALYKIGKDLTASFKQEVKSGPKTGRIYIVRNRLGRNVRHQASAAGETPANITGKYRTHRGRGPAS